MFFSRFLWHKIYYYLYIFISKLSYHGDKGPHGVFGCSTIYDPAQRSGLDPLGFSEFFFRHWAVICVICRATSSQAAEILCQVVDPKFETIFRKELRRI